jgi:dTDP-4-amino-4,6-dideoxygalactose transaminase
MAPLMEIASRHDLAVIEDAAQAHGARYKGRRTGSLGHAAAFSFYPTKNLGAYGDGGAVTTDDTDVAEAVRLLRNYGSPGRGRTVRVGYNSRLDELQARLLTVKLSRLEDWNDQRRRQAAVYMAGLATTHLALPVVPAWAEPAWHLFVVRSPRRNDLATHLSRHGVETLIHYPVPPHLQPAYSYLDLPRGALPVSELIHNTVLSLPIGMHLSDTQVRTVVAAIRHFDAECGR